MITIFILLGLGFLCGGAAAIVDGLPYMVLERGFTQVIIGTVAAAAGVLMLALSWVLVEIRRLKRTLSSAAMAMSVASMVGNPATVGDVALPDAEARLDDETAARMSPGVPAAGTGALAGAALAATRALGAPARSEPESAEAPHELADKPAEPDLFGGDIAEHAGEQEERRAAEAPVVPEALRVNDVDALPVFDPFRPIDPHGEPGPRFETAPFETPSFDTEAEPVGPAAPMAEAAAGHESTAEPDESAAEASPVDEAAAPAATGDADPAREADEFGLLRESLTALRLDSKPAGGRIEPSFSETDRTETSSVETGRGLDDLAAAGNWMEPALQRRAPWFGDTGEIPREDVAQPETGPEPVWPTTWPEPVLSGRAPETDTPLWPPQAREAAAFEPEPAGQATDGEETDGDTAAFGEAPSVGPAEAGVPELAEPAPDADAAEQSAAPATSDEGIVGAYQVGEAHFTIYADGSIQARTPDGDYSFTSMDELKIYLASEKSRLGV